MDVATEAPWKMLGAVGESSTLTRLGRAADTRGHDIIDIRRLVGMADVLIRGLSEAAVAHIDASAAARGLSRQEYLRRRFETERSEAQSQGKLTAEDMRRAAAAAADLDDPEVMEGAWR
jgi:hypothetical protein